MPTYSSFSPVFIMPGVLWTLWISSLVIAINLKKISVIFFFNISSVPFYLSSPSGVSIIHVTPCVVVPVLKYCVLFFFNSVCFLCFPVFEISMDVSPEILSSGEFNLQISPSKEFSTCLAVFISSISFCFLLRISISGYIPHPFVHVAYTLNTLAELF